MANNQCENQITTVKYLKTTPFVDPKTGEKYFARHFSLTLPDRYIPVAKEGLPGDVIV